MAIFRNKAGYSRFAVFSVITFIMVVSSSCGMLKFEKDKAEENVWIGGINVGGYQRKELQDTVRNIAQSIDVSPVNAVLDDKKWIVVQEERYGKKVNIEKTVEMLLNAEEGERIEPVVEQVVPLVTADLLKANVIQVTQFSTPLIDKSPNRIKNIKLAVAKLDFVQLKPGKEFSFNKVVGKRTVTNGFLEAPIIVETTEGVKTDNEVGGGICQVTTTLFNAVKQGGFEITERHAHSGFVTYAPKGQDATVYYGEIDFRFRNNSPYPIMIRTSMDEKSVTVKIFENKN